MSLLDKIMGVITPSPEPDEGTFPLPVDEYTIPDNDDNDAANKRHDEKPVTPPATPRKKRGRK